MIVRATVTEDVSGAVIELVFDLLQPILGDRPEVTAFREVLPHQSVEVLYSAFLP